MGNYCLNYVDLPIVRATYFALIYPHLQYRINSNKEHTSPLFHQSKCIKFLDISDV